MGECLMDVTFRRGDLLTGDTIKILGHPEMAAVACHRWREMKEKYGSVPVMLERHKDELFRYAFGGGPDVAGVFLEVEQDYLRLADGAAEALAHLRDEGVELSVVTAARSGAASFEDTAEYRFIAKHRVLQYFDSIISPRGKLRLSDHSVDERYTGTSKEDGTIYETLAEDLAERGISPDEGVMMGDREWTDIGPARRHGFKTILYSGYIRRGPTEADLETDSFRKLPELVQGPRSLTLEAGWSGAAR